MAKTAELTAESTHEDITKAIDQVIEDRMADEPPETEDRAKPKTSDAEKVGTGKAVTERDTEDTAAVSPTGQDVSEKTGKDKAAESDEDSDWRKEAKAEASAYGISEKDVAEFQSREELDRALKLFDRNLDAERKKVRGELDVDSPTGHKPEGQEDKGGKTQKKSLPAGSADEAEPSGSGDGAYQIKLNPDVYDEELVGELTRMRDHYESRLTALEGRLKNVAATAEEERFGREEERFDRGVDSLEFSQLFGKTGEESADELKRRNDLLEQVRIEQIVMSRLGRSVDYNALVQRVARSLFPEEYDKRLIKNHTRKVSRQSDKRLGGGTTRATDPPQGLREDMRQLYKELDQQSG